MEAKDTVLVGCEVLCLSFEGSDYVACPLPLEEQKVCRQRLQYQAGIREVVEWLKRHRTETTKEFVDFTILKEKWQAKLKEWEYNSERL